MSAVRQPRVSEAIPLVHVRDFARHADLATTQGDVHRIEDEKVTAAIGEALAGTRQDVM